MGIGKLTQRLGDLRMLLFPAFAATESRLRPQTDDPASAFGQAKRDSLAPPPKDLIFTHIFGFCDSAGIFKEGKTNSSNPLHKE